MSTNNRQTAEEPGARWRYGTWVVFGGLGAVVLSLLATVWAYQDVTPATDSASAIATVLAPVTTVIGTVVGAYFGLQVGQAGAAKAREERDEAEATARKLAAVGDPKAVAEIVGAPTPTD